MRGRLTEPPSFLSGGASMTEPKVNFLIAGVQKAGTTALFHYLRQNSQIFLPPKKEIHFFRHGADSIQPYHAEFEGWLGRRICGEATPNYIYLEHAIRRIHAYRPDIRLVICLRNPVERGYSAWCMERARGRETLSFSEAIRGGRARIRSDALRDKLTFSYVERGFYAAQLNQALKYFGANQFFIIRSDEIKDDHEAMVQLQHFLGVDPVKLRPLETHYMPGIGSRPTPSSLVDDFAYLHNLYRDDLLQLQIEWPIDVSDWLSSPPDLER